MRSNRLVRVSNCQCRSRNSPAFDLSLLRHSGIWGAADEAVLNTVHRKKKIKKIPLFNYVLRNFVPVPLYQGYLGELCRDSIGGLFWEDLFQGWINFLQKGFRSVLKERIIRVFWGNITANGANVFCYLSSLPLLFPATTAVFGSYLSSLYS
jgi:hypothetical protein